MSLTISNQRQGHIYDKLVKATDTVKNFIAVLSSDDLFLYLQRFSQHYPLLRLPAYPLLFTCL